MGTFLDVEVRFHQFNTHQSFLDSYSTCRNRSQASRRFAPAVGTREILGCCSGLPSIARSQFDKQETPQGGIYVRFCVR